MNSIVRSLKEMMPWQGARHTLEVIGIVDEAPQVKTFIFGPTSAFWFAYLPGQFLTLELPTGNGTLLRTYTLSSTPSRPFSIAVTVKTQSSSVGGRWMFDHLQVGSRIHARGPAGDFSHHNHSASKYLFISAGSGITPMMSMTRWLHDCAPSSDVCFVNCARKPDEIIFRRELELLEGRMPRLALGFFVDQFDARESWSGHAGRIDEARLRSLSPDFSDREIFCCGPAPFMDAVRDMLAAAGFNMERYHQESFAGADAVANRLPPACGRAGETSEAGMPVRFGRSGIDGRCTAGQTILQAARAAGLTIPSACEAGICGTCRVRKLTGEVEMHHQGGILDEEIDDGYILACCSTPLSPVEVDV